MENEINNYHIDNPDGAPGRHLNEGRLRFRNDTPRFIREAPTSAQKEFSRPKESFAGHDHPASGNQSGSGTNGPTNNVDAINNFSSTLTPATGSFATGAASTVTSGAAATTTVGSTIASAIGGSIGAITGVVASTVAAAVIVVAVFISTLTVNLTLVMADMDRLVFRLEMQGAQDQDFENGVYAILENSDGAYQEQKISPNSVFITFNDLSPNKEYLITIKTGDKTLAEKTYVTAASKISRGSISVRTENKTVFIDVSDVVLGAEEIFTVTAKDMQGEVLFVKDDKGSSGSYSFSVTEPKTLHCTLSIAGVTYAIADAEIKKDPEYNFGSPIWSWTADNTATLSFVDMNGGDPLVIPAEIGSVYTAPTCEKDGFTTYTATAVANDRSYSDNKTVADEGTALGHDYSVAEFIWTPLSGVQNAASSDATTILGYTVTVKFHCSHNSEHINVVTIDPKDIRHEISLPSCETDGFIVYYASVVYSDTEYSDEHTDVLAATGHSYASTPTFIWEETQDGYTSTAKFVCANNEEHVIPLETIVTPVYTEPTCEEDGYTTYTATATYNNEEYSDTKIVIDEETAIGHDYSVAEFIWTPVSDAPSGSDDIPLFGVTVKFHCSHNSEHVCDEIMEIEPEYIDYSVTPATCEADGKISYYAFLLFHDNQYRDDHEIVLPTLGHDYGEAPVFTWTDEGGEYSVTAAFVCANDEEHDHDIVLETDISFVYTEPTCEEDGYMTYTATATDANGVEYTDTKIVIDEETATGHAFEADGEWVDNGDGTFTVTAIITCENCSFHDTYPVESTSIQEDTTLYVEATCVSDGKRVYNAGLEYLYHDDPNGFNITHTVVLPALGHDYGDTPVFTWTEEDGEYSVTAAFVCANDRYHDHDIVLESEITSVETSPVTCTEDGYTTYTATATYDGQEYTDVKVVPGESAPGHGTLELTKASPATFSQSGVLKHYTCPVCGKHYAYSTGENEIEDVVV
ncbi:MAG: hypothetical protein J5781_02985, partial [Clostridia bacterium]|nr:hypothetical protein [Clostridia bacterium]